MRETPHAIARSPSATADRALSVLATAQITIIAVAFAASESASDPSKSRNRMLPPIRAETAALGTSLARLQSDEVARVSPRNCWLETFKHNRMPPEHCEDQSENRKGRSFPKRNVKLAGHHSSETLLSGPNLGEARRFCVFTAQQAGPAGKKLFSSLRPEH